jgi:hypothetical protein
MLYLPLSPYLFFPWRNSPQWARASSLSRLHDHTQTKSHCVGFLWTSDQPDAENSTSQHNTHNRQTSISPSGIQTRNPSKRASSRIPRLRLRGHWDQTVFVQAVEILHRTCEMWYNLYFFLHSRFQWPRGLRRGSTAARQLRTWVRKPQGA